MPYIVKLSFTAFLLSGTLRGTHTLFVVRSMLKTIDSIILYFKQKLPKGVVGFVTIRGIGVLFLRTKVFEIVRTGKSSKYFRFPCTVYVYIRFEYLAQMILIYNDDKLPVFVFEEKYNYLGMNDFLYQKKTLGS